ncbi:MAG TPA: trigger factor [Bacteroidia bacterium]|nr:trigger factor [Bacteroidia bacterium]
MNISREAIGNLNEMLRIKLTPEDYGKQYESEIKKYQRSASMPGFRPGHVPAGLIKKRYGKAILIDELNKLVSGSLEQFINENKLNILGNPIPQTSDSSKNNFDEPGEFEFEFEIGLAPEFNLTLPPSKTFDYYEIEVDDKKVQLYMDDLRRKYGKFSNPESANEQSILYGDLAELDASGAIKEGGLTSRSTLSIEGVKDQSLKKQLTGTKKGDVIKINLSKAFAGDKEEIAHMLNIPQEQASVVVADFHYTVDTVNQVEKAEMDAEFFNKVYGEGVVNNEAEFRDKVVSELAGMYAQESDHKLKHDLEDFMIEDLKLSLPDEFLKKWLQTAVEKPLSAEQVEKEYSGYARGMKLRLVENRIFKDNDLKITQEEIRDTAREYIMHQFAGYSSGLGEDLIDNLVSRYLEKKESVERIIETLSDRKVFNYLKSVIKTKPKKVSYDKFVEIVKEHNHSHH